MRLLQGKHEQDGGRACEAISTFSLGVNQPEGCLIFLNLACEENVVLGLLRAQPALSRGRWHQDGRAQSYVPLLNVWERR